MSTLSLVTLALAALCAGLAALFFLARKLENYGIVDVAWSYAFGLLAGFYAVFASGWPIRRAVISGMVAVWSLRLGTHLLIRVSHHHPKEDARYAQLRRDWAANFGPKMFGFFQLQAASVVLLGTAFIIACRNDTPALHPLEYIGIALWVIAIAGEATADAQLAAFKRETREPGRVCDVGLWRFSRHPNYFFEWLIWVAYFVFALASPGGWLAIIGPASILFLLLRVTGIPMAEEQSLRSRGAAYRRYQATTSAFVPWFPKRSP
jgi:steroid 5-alpha reductase family enzyme